MLRMAALLAGAATLASAGDGQLILRKHVASQPCVIQGVKSDCIVEGQETDIMYSVYNVGESAAYGVKIVDGSLSDGFDVVGELNGDVGEIAGGENKTVAVSVKAKSSGELTVGPAEVSYKPTADGKKMTGASTEPAGCLVETQREHKKRTSIHYLEWFFFSILAGIAVGVPGMAISEDAAKKSS